MMYQTARQVWAAGTMCVFIATCLSNAANAIAEPSDSPRLDFEVKLDVPLQQLSNEFCWFHPRAASVSLTRSNRPAAVITLQKHLQVSDYYSGLWMLRSDDLGETWSGPTEIPELAWQKEPNGVIIAVADVTPGWHANPAGILHDRLTFDTACVELADHIGNALLDQRMIRAVTGDEFLDDGP